MCPVCLAVGDLHCRASSCLARQGMAPRGSPVPINLWDLLSPTKDSRLKANNKITTSMHCLEHVPKALGHAKEGSGFAARTPRLLLRLGFDALPDDVFMG